MRTTFIVFAANVLLWTAQAQLNHSLAPLQLTVFVGGLGVAFAALRLSYREGVRALLLTGLWADAASPVPFGLHAFLFIGAQTAIFGIRGRLAREDTVLGLILAALSNLLVFAVISLLLLSRNPEPLRMAGRLIADSLVSFCVLVLVGPWFFAFTEKLLEYCGVNLRREQRGVV